MLYTYREAERRRGCYLSVTPSNPRSPSSTSPSWSLPPPLTAATAQQKNPPALQSVTVRQTTKFSTCTTISDCTTNHNVFHLHYSQQLYNETLHFPLHYSQQLYNKTQHFPLHYSQQLYNKTLHFPLHYSQQLYNKTLHFPLHYSQQLYHYTFHCTTISNCTTKHNTFHLHYSQQLYNKPHFPPTLQSATVQQTTTFSTCTTISNCTTKHFPPALQSLKKKTILVGPFQFHCDLEYRSRSLKLVQQSLTDVTLTYWMLTMWAHHHQSPPRQIKELCINHTVLVHKSHCGAHHQFHTQQKPLCEPDYILTFSSSSSSIPSRSSSPPSSSGPALKQDQQQQNKVCIHYKLPFSILELLGHKTE